MAAGPTTTTTTSIDAEAERRLLDLHGRLWGLATELLLPSEASTSSSSTGAKGGRSHGRRPTAPRPPRAIIEVS